MTGGLSGGTGEPFPVVGERHAGMREQLGCLYLYHSNYISGMVVVSLKHLAQSLHQNTLTDAGPSPSITCGPSG